jgi:carbamoyl-phosphate synthase small subunit
MDLAKVVSTTQRYDWDSGSVFDAPSRPAGEPLHVVACDYGVKHNILRLLVDAGCRVTVVPAQTAAADVLAMRPDGVFLSNGRAIPSPAITRSRRYANI